jgi:hypothetical protein
MATTSVPAVLTKLAAQLRLRANLVGVAVHTYDVGTWTDLEAIVLSQVEAPQSWSGMFDPGIDESATMRGYIFTTMAGATDADADTAHARAGVLLNELAQQVRTDPNVNSAITTPVESPLLTGATWQTWPDEIDQSGVIRIRVDWVLTWTAGT